MTGLLNFLKLLCVPMLMAALSQVILLLARGESWHAVDPDTGLSFSDAARNAFVSQASLALWVTVLVGLPLLRWLSRQGRSSIYSWLGVWGLVNLPYAAMVAYNEASSTRWVELQCLALSLLVVAGLWWRWFYAEGARPAENAEPPRQE